MKDLNQDGQKRDTYKKWMWSLVSLLLAILTIRMVMRQSKAVSVSQIAETVRLCHKGWLLLAIVAAGLYVWLEGTAIRAALHAAGYRRGLFQGLLYSTADIYFSAVTPSAMGGQPASAYFMIRDDVPGGVAAAALVLNLVMYTLAIVVLGVLALVIHPTAFLDFNRFSRVLVLAGFAVLMVLSVLFIMVLKKGDRFFRRAKRLTIFLYHRKLVKNVKKTLLKLDRAERDYENCIVLIEKQPGIMLRIFIWAFLQRTAQILVPVFLYLSFGGRGNRAVMLFCKQCLITIGYNFVPIPGAMGVSDYLMLDGFKKIVEHNMAYRLELFARCITFYCCVSVSGVITLIGYLAGRKKEPETICERNCRIE